MDLVRIEPPILEVMSNDEAKAHLRIDGSQEDSLISALIKAATTHAENFTERSFLTQKWRLTLDNLPHRKGSGEWWDGVREVAKSTVFDYDNLIFLKRGPIASIDSFKYFTLGDTELTFDAENYFLDPGDFKGRVILKNGKTWPTGLRTRMAIQIEYTAQMADTKTGLGDDLKEAVKLILAHLYEHRGDGMALGSSSLKSSVANIPETAKFLLSPYVAPSL